MTYLEVLEQIRKVQVAEVRLNLADEVEFVVAQEFLAVVTALLERYFGPPAKAARTDPSRDMQRYCLSRGGIWPGQTLYSHTEGAEVHCAMLWPWADGNFTTIKVFIFR